ncbi:MAG: heme o synthase [Planctomycetota bacterium]
MSTGATTLSNPDRAAAAVAQTASSAGMQAKLADYAELAKPRITVLELVTVVAAMQLAVAATGASWEPASLVAMMLGTTLLAASANTLNQYLEVRHDRVMKRTADRPLPTGRMQRGEAAAFGIASVAVGVTLLTFGVNGVTAGLGLLCWFLYVAVYTPMKRVSPWNTFVGAVSGAIPIVMGWTAGGGPLDLAAAGLFAVLFCWQYPHFMAIAWLCREDYAAAGYKMTTVVEPTGRRAGAHAMVGAALLAPASLLPAIALSSTGAVFYACAVLVLAAALFYVAARFYQNRCDATARKLLRGSLIYLPVWMLLLVLCLP